MRNNYRTFSRRQFLRYSAVTGTVALAVPYVGNVLGANERINVACVGVGGKGDSDSNATANCGGNIVALCDVDANTLNKKAQKFPEAKKYRDFRKLFAEMEKDIDAVTVSIPDHMHGLVTATAMRLGKHVYCQKPLVQTVYEARLMRQLAKEKHVATQMGNQGSAANGLRRAVEVIQAGIIGPVHELHVWSNRPIWPQGVDRPAGEDPVPATLDWDLWLGTANQRPFKNDVYHPFKWRGWYDFGCGALGDMACHTVNMPFRALKLGYPDVIECESTSDMHPETFPLTSRIRFEFPAREDMAPLKFWWYDGNPNSPTTKRPPTEATKEIVEMRDKLPGSGCLLIGEKGKLFSPDDYGTQFFVLLKEEKDYTSGNDHPACKAVPQSIPRSPGHNQEWFNAMKAGKPELAYSNFDIAAYLTETILLGCVALRHGVGKRIDWDGPNAKAKNADLSHLTRRQHRAGWEV